ncbi:hypothetical protein D3C77_611950 [compost metagenome]
MCLWPLPAQPQAGSRYPLPELRRMVRHFRCIPEPWRRYIPQAGKVGHREDNAGNFGALPVHTWSTGGAMYHPLQSESKRLDQYQQGYEDQLGLTFQSGYLQLP